MGIHTNKPYTGTGTYGSANPNSITCSFAPKFIWLWGTRNYSSATSYLDFYSSTVYNIMEMGKLTDSYTSPNGFTQKAGNWNSSDMIRCSYAKKSSDGKTLSWYIEPGSITITGIGPAGAQMNTSNAVYLYLAIG